MNAPLAENVENLCRFWLDKKGTFFLLAIALYFLFLIDSRACEVSPRELWKWHLPVPVKTEICLGVSIKTSKKSCCKCLVKDTRNEYTHSTHSNFSFRVPLYLLDIMPRNTQKKREKWSGFLVLTCKLCLYTDKVWCDLFDMKLL